MSRRRCDVPPPLFGPRVGHELNLLQVTLLRVYALASAKNHVEIVDRFVLVKQVVSVARRTKKISSSNVNYLLRQNAVFGRGNGRPVVIVQRGELIANGLE